MGLHEHSWDAPTSAGDAGWCHCKAALDYLWKIAVITVTERFLKDKENLGQYRPVSLPLAPGKVTEQLNSETISGHVKDQKVTGSHYHGFTKAKWCLTKWVVSYNKTHQPMHSDPPEEPSNWLKEQSTYPKEQLRQKELWWDTCGLYTIRPTWHPTNHLGKGQKRNQAGWAAAVFVLSGLAQQYIKHRREVGCF